MAVGPHGALYIADDARNQILARAPAGRVVVIVGTGQAGFSGDGGRATHARLHTPGGMAIAGDGTLYIADSANGRVRALSPGGILSTVAGNGRCGGWVPDGTPARAAPLCWPAALTIGPDGRLYIADEGANAVFQLTARGTLRRIVGSRSCAGVCGLGQPATHASADGPSALAFDRSGDLYIAGQNTKTLLMITHNHIMTRPYGGYGLYPHGDAGFIADRDGSVIAMASQEIIRLTPRGVRPIVDFSRSHLLGRRDAFLPNGIAVAPDGTIYTDTWAGNGWTTITALVAFRPGTAAAQVLWTSH